MIKYYFLVLSLFLFCVAKAQIVNIPDANFKAKLLAASSSNSIAKNFSGNFIKIDANNDGEIQVVEALEVDNLNVNDNGSLNLITSLEGILSFTNLRILMCSNNKLATINVKSLVNLKSLTCSQNEITSLDSKLPINLESLNCSRNQIQSLNISSFVNLLNLNCSFNQLTSIDVAPLVNLKYLDCSSNKLAFLNVIPLVNLITLYCSGNQIASLDVTPLINLTYLGCTNNQLNSLDLKNQTNLVLLDCGVNNITNLFIKNTKILTIPGALYLSFSSNVQYICANDRQLADVQKYIYQSGYTNTHVNTYCTFVPGAEFYNITGNAKLDFNTNGCDFGDLNCPNLKFSISNGSIFGSLTSDTTGRYSTPVQVGTHTITPVIENPNYFIVSPINAVVTFPTQTSPFTKNFCLTSNGVHPDLEISLIPLTRAKSGFNASYKIIYKNKGTNTQSGSVNLTFDTTVIDLVTSNPLVNNQITNASSWNFIDLKPFETREIIAMVNINGPMETPAVNEGDTLEFTATITSIANDETPIDNIFTLNQTVVNSFDPNDKTCLEGATIPPSAIGKYVHYMIRFENKGTAEAQNVVVKDMIDTSKFDINSLIVTQGSHPFVTKISETNKVEFIFENINLPFDDANNDGYIAFKIKTKPSMVVGDSFSNTASIYFDYNYPIVTNTATTSVLQNLGNQDFEFSTYSSVYPNPVKSVLNIDVKKQIELSSISIYNTLGQQIVVIPNAQQTKQVDVSNLKSGNYFIKLTSNQGSASGKFVKE